MFDIIILVILVANFAPARSPTCTYPSFSFLARSSPPPCAHWGGPCTPPIMKKKNVSWQIDANYTCGYPNPFLLEHLKILKINMSLLLDDVTQVTAQSGSAHLSFSQLRLFSFALCVFCLFCRFRYESPLSWRSFIFGIYSFGFSLICTYLAGAPCVFWPWLLLLPFCFFIFPHFSLPLPQAGGFALFMGDFNLSDLENLRFCSAGALVFCSLVLVFLVFRVCLLLLVFVLFWVSVLSQFSLLPSPAWSIFAHHASCPLLSPWVVVAVVWAFAGFASALLLALLVAYVWPTLALWPVFVPLAAFLSVVSLCLALVRFVLLLFCIAAALRVCHSDLHCSSLAMLLVCDSTLGFKMLPFYGFCCRPAVLLWAIVAVLTIQNFWQHCPSLGGSAAGLKHADCSHNTGRRDTTARERKKKIKRKREGRKVTETVANHMQGFLFLLTLLLLIYGLPFWVFLLYFLALALWVVCVMRHFFFLFLSLVRALVLHEVRLCHRAFVHYGCVVKIVKAACVLKKYLRKYYCYIGALIKHQRPVSQLASLRWLRNALLLFGCHGARFLASIGCKYFTAVDLRLWGWLYLRLRIGSPSFDLVLSKHISLTALILAGLWSAFVSKPFLMVINLLINSYLLACAEFSGFTCQWVPRTRKYTILALRALMIDFHSPLLGVCSEYFFFQLVKDSLSPFTMTLKNLGAVFANWYHALWSKLVFTTNTKVRYVQNARRTLRIGIFTTFDTSTGIVLTYCLKYKLSHFKKAKFYHHGLRQFSADISKSQLRRPVLQSVTQADNLSCCKLSRIVGGGRLQKDTQPVTQVTSQPVTQASSPPSQELSRIVGGGRLQTDAVMRARKVRTAQWRHRYRRQKIQTEEIKKIRSQKLTRDESFLRDPQWWKSLIWLNGRT